MSIKSMCKGSTAVRLVQSHSVGEAGGDVSTFTDGATLDCNAQTMSADVSTRYDIRGERRGWTLFFAADPSLTVDNYVRLTTVARRTLSPAKILRVLASETEDNPLGGLPLWIVYLEEVTTRFDA